MVRAYELGGAAALSILTHPHFDGTLDDLHEARAESGLPILRKDFTVDPYQIYEAKAYGADAVLIVVSALGRHEVGMLYGIARDLGLDALVEVRDEEDLEIALELDVDVIGINNRDLDNYAVKVERTLDLHPRIPIGKIVVSESGIKSRQQIEELEHVGVDAFLVGSSLMLASDPEAAVRELSHTDEPTQA